MDRMLAYIGLHLRLQFAKDQKSDKKGDIITMLIALATGGVMLFLIKYFFDMLANQFSEVVDVADFSTLIFTAVELVLAVYCVSLEIKCLLKPFDLKISARFPMSSFQLFVSELAIVYINLQFMTLLTFLPLTLVFGWSSGVMSGAFVGRVILATFFAPILPFAVGTILAVPSMYISALLENHGFIKLVLFIGVLVGALVLYNYVLDLLADYFIHKRIEEETKQVMASFIAGLNSVYNPAVLLKNIVYKRGIGKSIGIVLGLGAAAFLVGLAIAKPIYDKVRIQGLEGRGRLFAKSTRYTSDSAFLAILKRELKDIMRTNTYAFFYLGVAITTPVMVFFCDRLVTKFGNAQIGGDIAYGVSILVLLAFMTMINCFTASAISREKETFYISKITPMYFRLQLLAKGVLNLVVAMGALAISLVIIGNLEFVTPLEGGIIFIMCFFGAIGMIANGFNLNLRAPNLQTSTSGEVSQTNMTMLLLIGLLLSAAEGSIAIVLSYLTDPMYAYIANAVITFVYCAVNVLVFAFTADKKYERIEFR